MNNTEFKIKFTYGTVEHLHEEMCQLKLFNGQDERVYIADIPMEEKERLLKLYKNIKII